MTRIPHDRGEPIDNRVVDAREGNGQLIFKVSETGFWTCRSRVSSFDEKVEAGITAPN
jgi:hypothetical protein